MNVAICDDHKMILNAVESMTCRVLGNDCNITAFADGYELIEYIYGGIKNVDILITDIKLGNLNGIELAKRIKGDYPNVKIIFITGYAEYSQEIFEAGPSYFLLKPIKEEKFRQAVDFVLKAGENGKEKYLPFKIKSGGIKSFLISDVIYFESRMRKVILHSKTDGETETYGKLDELESKLPENYIRCHQSYIVNMNSVTSLNARSFSMCGGMEIPISQTKYGNVKRKYFIFLGKRFN